jgi:hypothetical protein
MKPYLNDLEWTLSDFLQNEEEVGGSDCEGGMYFICYIFLITVLLR